MNRTLYEVIGVKPTATREEIEAACVALGQQFSPETNAGNVTAHERFSEIEAAYETLIDQTRRAAYDEGLAASRELTNAVEFRREDSSHVQGVGALPRIMQRRWIIASLAAVALTTAGYYVYRLFGSPDEKAEVVSAEAFKEFAGELGQVARGHVADNSAYAREPALLVPVFVTRLGQWERVGAMYRAQAVSDCQAAAKRVYLKRFDDGIRAVRESIEGLRVPAVDVWLEAAQSDMKVMQRIVTTCVANPKWHKQNAQNVEALYGQQAAVASAPRLIEPNCTVDGRGTVSCSFRNTGATESGACFTVRLVGRTERGLCERTNDAAPAPARDRCEGNRAFIHSGPVCSGLIRSQDVKQLTQPVAFEGLGTSVWRTIPEWCKGQLDPRRGYSDDWRDGCDLTVLPAH